MGKRFTSRGRNRSSKKQVVVAFVLGLFLLSGIAGILLVAVPVSRASIQPPQQIAQQTTTASVSASYISPTPCFVAATCLTITSPSSLFNGVPQSNVTANYVFTSIGIPFYYNSIGSNFSVAIMTAKWGTLLVGRPLIVSGMGSNSSAVWYNYVNGPFTGSNTASVTVYYEERISNGYVSPNLKVVIQYIFSGSGTLSFTFLNPNNAAKICQATSVLFGSTGYDWSDSVSQVASFSCSTATLTYNVGMSGIIDPVTVTTTTSAGSGGTGSFEKQIWFADTRYWLFNYNGTDIGCWSSSDAISWSAKTIMIPAQSGLGPDFSVWMDSSNNIYYAWTTDGVTGSIIHHRDGALSPSGCGSITWNYADATVTPKKTTSSEFITTSATSTSNEWVAIGTFDGTTHYAEIWKCTTSCGTASNWSNKDNITTPFGAGNLVVPSVFTYTSSSNAVVFYGASSSGTQGLVYVIDTNNGGTSWSTALTAGSLSDGDTSSCMISGSTLYCAYYAQISSVSYTKFFTFVHGASSLNEITIAGNSATYGRTNAVSVSSQSIAVAQMGSAASQVWFVSNDGGATWSPPVTVSSDTQSSSGNNQIWIIPSPTSTQTAAIMYLTGTSSPFNVRVATGVISVVQPVTCTMANSAPQATVTLSGGAPNPSSSTCNGGSVNVVAVPSITLMATESSGGNIIQQKGCGTTTATSIACAFTNNVVSGDTLIIIVLSANGLTNVAVSDTIGNTWIHVSGSLPYGATVSGYEDAYYVEPGKNAGADTVTYSNSNTISTLAVTIFEVSNQLAPNNIATGTGTATSSSVSSFTPTAGDLVIGWGIMASATCTSPTGYTRFAFGNFGTQCDTGTSGNYFSADNTNAANSATTVSFSFGASNGFSETAIDFSSSTPLTRDVFGGATSSTGSGTGTALATGSVSFGTKAFLFAGYIGDSTVNHNPGTGFTDDRSQNFEQEYIEYATSGVSSPTTFPASAASSSWWIEAGVSFPASSTPTVAQSSSNRCSPAVTCNSTPSGNVASGNTLVIAGIDFNANTACPALSVSDTKGFVFSPEVNICGISHSAQVMIWSASITSSGSDTVTLTSSVSVGLTIYVYEISSLTKDGPQSQVTCSSGTCASWSLTNYYQTGPTNNFEYLLASGGSAVSGNIIARYYVTGILTRQTFTSANANSTLTISSWIDWNSINWDSLSSGSGSNERWANSLGTNETASNAVIVAFGGGHGSGTGGETCSAGAGYTLMTNCGQEYNSVNGINVVGEFSISMIGSTTAPIIIGRSQFYDYAGLAFVTPYQSPTHFFVQQNGNSSTTTSLKTPFTSSVTSGDLLVAGSDSQGVVPTGISDSRCTSWTQIIHDTTGNANGEYVYMWYCFASSSGADTVTATYGSSNTAYLAIWEFSGVSSSATVLNTQTSTPPSSTTVALPNFVLTSGLASYWPMDEATSGTCSGSVADLVGINTATCTNSPTFTNGEFSGALNFSSSRSEYASASNNGGGPFTISGDITISAWINLASLGTNQMITYFVGTGSTNGYIFEIQSNNYPLCGVYNSGGFDSIAYNVATTSNTWVNLVCERSGNTLAIYLNGVLVNSKTTTKTGTLSDTGSSLYIGSDRTPATFFNGKIDDLRIYNRALSSWEVSELYHLTATTPNLATYFDQLYYTVTATTSTPNDKTLSYTNYATLTLNLFGNAATTYHVFDGSANSTFVDRGGSIQFNTLSSASNSTTRWSANSIVIVSPVTGSGSITAIFYEQEFTTWNLALLTGGNNLASGVTEKIIWKAYGGTNTLTESSIPVSPQEWIDYGNTGQTTWAVQKAAYNVGTTERWITYGTNQTSDIDSGHHGGQSFTWTYQDELLATVEVKTSNAGGLVQTYGVQSITVKGNNNTVVTQTVNPAWMSRQWENATAIKWESTDVVLASSDKLNLQSNTAIYLTNIWQVNFGASFQDSGGTPLYRSPSTIVFNFVNSTIFTYNVPVANQTSSTIKFILANGTMSITSLTWESSVIKALSGSSFDPSVTQAPSIKTSVYSLNNALYGFESIGETNTCCQVQITYSNGTVITYPNGVGGAFVNWNTNVNFAQVQNGTISYLTYWRGQLVNGTSKLNAGATTGFTTQGGFSISHQANDALTITNYVWFNMAASGIELFESGGSSAMAIRIWDSTNLFLEWQLPTQAGYQILYWGLPGPNKAPILMEIGGVIWTVSSTSIFTIDPINKVITLSSVGGGTLVADFTGNLKGPTSSGGINYIQQNTQPSGAPPASSVQPTPTVFPSFITLLTAQAAQLILWFTNMPYGLGLLLPIVGILFVILATSRLSGPRPQKAELANKVIVERRGGPAPLRMVLTVALSSALSSGALVYILPYVGYPQLASLSIQTTLIIMFAIGLLAAGLVWVFVNTSTHVRAEG